MQMNNFLLEMINQNNDAPKKLTSNSLPMTRLENNTISVEPKIYMTKRQLVYTECRDK